MITKEIYRPVERQLNEPEQNALKSFMRKRMWNRQVVVRSFFVF